MKKKGEEKKGKRRKRKELMGGEVHRGYYGCKSVCWCVVVLGFKLRPKVLLFKIVFGRWGETASHDRCVSKGKEVKELCLYSASLS